MYVYTVKYLPILGKLTYFICLIVVKYLPILGKVD